MPDLPLTLADVERAAARLAGHVRHTPVRTAAALDRVLGAHVHLKCEQLQHTGAYKARGALNAVLQLPDGTAVCTHSSGNHGAALAWAAARRGMACTVVMPAGSSPIKVAAARRHGATVEFCAPGDRERAAADFAARTGATLVHPYEDPQVVAGQGTAVRELLADVPSLDLLVTPIGGGGLLAAAAVVAAALAPGCRVVGGEPAAADDAHRSLQTGVRQPAVPAPDTIADGLLGGIGALAFRILTGLGAEVVTVSDDEIRAAGRRLRDGAGIFAEPSAAVAVAGLAKVGVAGQRVGVVLTGANADPGWM